MNKQLHKPIRSAVSAAVLGLMASSSVFAAGFSLYQEASPVSIGNYAAGAAAEASDPSVGWYNPAGLALIHEKKVAFGGTGVFPTSKLTGTSTYTTPSFPDYTENFEDMNGAKDAFVPSTHIAWPVSNNVTFGLSVIAPWGLSTKWLDTSQVRYEATHTNLMTVDIAPQMGVRLTDMLAIGAGLDIQFAKVKFNRMVGSPATLNGFHLDPTLFDSAIFNAGHSYGFGFHAGVMTLFNEDHTRFGVNYQSQINHQFFGFSRLSGPLAYPGLNLANIGNALDNENVYYSQGLHSNQIGLPQMVTMSFYHDVTPKIALLGSVVYTGWHSFKEIELDGVAAPVPVGPVIIQTPVTSISPQHFHDAWRFALGMNYSVNDQLLIRLGGGYDQTPTNDTFREVRLPDADRWALSIGAHYQMYPSLGIDFGYTHLFADRAYINRTDAVGAPSDSGVPTYNVKAFGKASADLVGLQAVWTLDPAEVAAVATK